MADTVIKEAPVRRFEGFPRKAGALAALLILVGGIGWFLALGRDADRAWRAYLFNWLFWTSIASGAVMFSAAVVMTYAIWARRVRRIALSTVAFLPLAYLLFIPLLFAAPHILPWFAHGAGEKSTYLNMPFLAVRNLCFLAALFSVQMGFAYWALRPDVGLLQGRGDARAQSGLHRFISRNWQGQDVEEARAAKVIRRFAPVMGLLYAVAFSFVAFDFVMTLEIDWHSTLIGPYFFMAAFLGGIALTALMSVIYRAALGLREIIETQQLHDLGKLVFAFCVFWGYLFWAQYMVIWYGELPHEQAFVVHRLGGPYRPLAILVLFSLFLIPFFGLLGVAAKKTPATLAAGATVVLCGLWLERYILIYPTFYHTLPTVTFGLPEVAATLAFGGLFLSALLWFASRFPIVEVWQPIWEPELEETPGAAAAE
jgi:Ni/Fe-hydrogenase subunit HybB-like protein